ncbi:MAG TPA: tetratricopeptide repeat protein [Gemmataceae bacterium]|nr:tetratricopeptide repeat protein [Gemmataceae bacterium]
MGILYVRRGAAALALSAACLGGCDILPRAPSATPATPATAGLPAPLPPEPAVKLGPHEAAGVKVEFAHLLEKRDPAAAMSGYLEAHKQDPSNLDALLGIARLLDVQGRFAESMEYYRKAEAAQPKNTKVACNYGFSLYLQRRYREAEEALRQALARQPENARAHNNLGLVLARTGRPAEALVEFRRAGNDDADAHNNLASALTLEKSWAAAQAEYEKALALDPSSATAKKGLCELKMVMAKAERREPAE